jgi:hypothetical protein
VGGKEGGGVKFLIILLLADSVWAQPPSFRPDNPLNAQVTALKERVGTAEKAAEELKFEVGYLKERIAELEKSRHNELDFDPATLGNYQRLDSEITSVFTSLDQVERYLDGYKLEFRIANPTAMTINGFKLTVTWATRFKQKESDFKSWYAWVKTWKTKNLDFTQDLVPGRWTAVSVMIPDTKPEDFGFLRVSALKLNALSGSKFQ